MSSHMESKLSIVDFASLIPEKVCGMKKLEKSDFGTYVDVPAIRCIPKLCGEVQRMFREILFNRPHFRKILLCPSSKENERLVLLHTSVTSTEVLSLAQKTFMKEKNCEFVIHKLDLTYADFTFDEILRKVFPEGTKDIVTSFETVGHIAHFNLKPAMLEYKNIIGEVLLDKNKHIKTVVNKTNTIEETYRFFKMELLAGEDNMNATVYEHGCAFKFDYSKVYWNSRLQTEHKRIVDFVQPGDIVFDVFAGVGPFSIPLAKKKCKVYANDLNIESYKALIENVELNKVKNYVTAHNMEGRKFLESVVMEDNLCTNVCYANIKNNKHIIMNLPAMAPEFLDVFKEKYSIFDLPITVKDNIFVHCYCFAKTSEPESEVELRVSEVLGVDVSVNAKTYYVRRVAPNKVMMCVTFNLFWFEHSVEKCSCTSSDSILSRKRPFEGGVYPMSVPISKKQSGKQ